MQDDKNFHPKKADIFLAVFFLLPLLIKAPSLNQRDEMRRATQARSPRKTVEVKLTVMKVGVRKKGREMVQVYFF